MKLLIAENDQAMRLLLTENTQSWGYEVVPVEDGASAWAIMQKDDAPSLLLLGWKMPKLTGIDLCERIRKNNNGHTPYILMLTTYGNADNINPSLSKAVNDFIFTPLNKAELRIRLGIGSRVLQQQMSDGCINAPFNDAVDYKLLFECSVGPALIYQDGKYIGCNQAAIDLLACQSKEEVLSAAALDFSAPKQLCGTNSFDKSVEIISEAFERGNLRIEWLLKKQNGETVPVEVLLTAVPIGENKGLLISWKDLTDDKKKQEELHALAHYDVLTKLPNRVLFADRFTQAIAHSKRTNTMLAICFIDLDDFKPINDNHGHQVGDNILIEVAERIKKKLREDDTVSRQGGDEFTVILGGLESRDQAEQILNRMLASLSEPYIMGGETHYLTASCGASINSNHKTELDVLVRQADQAMYRAKQAGKNKFSFYNYEVTLGHN